MIRLRGADMATIKEHLSSDELEARYKTAADPIAKSHFHAVWLLSLGRAIGEVARLLSFSPRWVGQLIKRYNAGGPEALGDRRAGNGAAPRILTPAALAALKERMPTPPDDGGLWSGPKVARWLAQFHGLKSVHDQRGWDALIAIEYSIQRPRPRHPEAADEEDRTALKKSLRRRPPKSRAGARRPKSNSHAMDEHRLGLKPISRRIWAPVGERPTAYGHHRFEWLYVTGFVEPATGRTVWNVSTTISKEMFELILADFAETVGAGALKRVVLQLDNAGWHGPQNLAVPDGVRLVFQPAHSPELQPAEHLWEFVDEPLVNTYFEDLDALDHTVSERCAALTQQSEMIRNSALFHWWPRRDKPN